MAGFWCRLVSPRNTKRHCLAKFTLYVHITTFSALTHGLASRWVYVARTTGIHNIGHLLQPHEVLPVLRTKFIRAAPSDLEIYIYIYNYIIIIWDSFRQNGPSYIYIKCYKNASLLNRYIFRTVNAINFLFSTLHTTPFLYGKILLGVLHLLRASIATSDTPVGSNLP